MNETVDFVKENHQDPDYKMLWEYAIRRREEAENALEDLKHEHDDTLRELHEAQEKIEQLEREVRRLTLETIRAGGASDAFMFCIRAFCGREDE